MNIATKTLMVDKKANCKDEDAELLLLGAKPVDLDNYPKLQWIFRAGVGCDAIPIEQIQERGIKLFFPSKKTRELLSVMVAKMAVGWILSERTIERSIKEWYREPTNANKKVLIVGGGHVGEIVKQYCDGLGISRSVYDVKEYYTEPVWSQFDVITFHIPLISYEHGSVYRDNRHLVNKKFLARLKRSVVLINTSRGGIVNEEAMAAFLKDNPRAKYVTDVYEQEPYTDESPLSPYLGTQFFGSPHIGSYSEQVRAALTADVNDLISCL